ncbi:MAG: heavy-metal-associated domain-containing protein [Anaerolineaceae bacterium]|nr:heavy-metal-associated domain-containing protein [Anaerolineaceae bacterium]
MQTVIFSVPGIHCNHCTHTISMELSDVEGVSNVDADLSTKMVKVTFEPPADEAKLRATLAEINYPAEN